MSRHSSSGTFAKESKEESVGEQEDRDDDFRFLHRTTRHLLESKPSQPKGEPVLEDAKFEQRIAAARGATRGQLERSLDD